MSRRRGPRIRPERVAEQLRVDTAEILHQELKDPRLGLVTCTRVQVTSDLGHARLYVSVLGSEAEQKEAMKVLEGATGYVRRRLAARLGLKGAPDIEFAFDPSVEFGIRLETLIEETKERSPAEEPPDEFDDPGDEPS